MEVSASAIVTKKKRRGKKREKEEKEGKVRKERRNKNAQGSVRKGKNDHNAQMTDVLNKSTDKLLQSTVNLARSLDTRLKMFLIHCFSI